MIAKYYTTILQLHLYPAYYIFDGHIYIGFYFRSLFCLFPVCLYLSTVSVNIKKAKVEKRELYAIKNIVNITRNIIYSINCTTTQIPHIMKLIQKSAKSIFKVQMSILCNIKLIYFPFPRSLLLIALLFHYIF